MPIEHMNSETRSAIRSRRIQQPPRRGRDESMQVNAEFAATETDPVRKRGEIRIADLDSRLGTEPGKTRPVLIVQSPALLDVDHPSTLIIPLTTNLVDDAAPLRIRVRTSERISKESDLMIDQMLAKESDLMIDQMLEIDNRRLTNWPLTMLSADTMAAVDGATKEVLDLADREGLSQAG